MPNPYYASFALMIFLLWVAPLLIAGVAYGYWRLCENHTSINQEKKSLIFIICIIMALCLGFFHVVKTAQIFGSLYVLLSATTAWMPTGIALTALVWLAHTGIITLHQPQSMQTSTP